MFWALLDLCPAFLVYTYLVKENSHSVMYYQPSESNTRCTIDDDVVTRRIATIHRIQYHQSRISIPDNPTGNNSKSMAILMIMMTHLCMTRLIISVSDDVPSIHLLHLISSPSCQKKKSHNLKNIS